MADALRKAYPGKRLFRVLEDNDPTGFKSRIGIQAKSAASINAFEIPPRSPDLNVLDFAIWKAVTRKMHKQERNYPKSLGETRAQYIARLQRAAKSLPKTTVDKAIMNLKHRCNLIYKAQVAHIEEGGH